MRLNVFIAKLITKSVFLAAFGLVTKAVNESAILTNEMALGQMQNSNEAFMKWEFYQKIQPIMYILFGCYMIWFAYTLFRDTQKLNKTYEEKEQE